MPFVHVFISIDILLRIKFIVILGQDINCTLLMGDDIIFVAIILIFNIAYTCIFFRVELVFTGISVKEIQS